MSFYRVLPPLPTALLLQQAEGNEDWKTDSHFFMHTYNSVELSSSQEYSEESYTIHFNRGRMQSLHECDYYKVFSSGEFESQVPSEPETMAEPLIVHPSCLHPI